MSELASISLLLFLYVEFNSYIFIKNVAFNISADEWQAVETSHK